MGTAMRMLITGSRNWRDEMRVYAALDAIVAASGLPASDWTLVHGDCPTGADEIAKRWAAARFAKPEEHPADWRQFGQSAGFKRNVEMAQAGADICVVFMRPCTSDHCSIEEVHGSHGTAHCERAARAAKIPVVVYQEGW